MSKIILNETATPTGVTNKTIIWMDADGKLYADIDNAGPVELGGTTIDSGTSFPGSPASGDYFFRTDLGTLFRYNGATWDGWTLPIGSFPVSPSTNDLAFSTAEAGLFRWNSLAWSGVGDIHTVPFKNVLYNNAFAVWQRGTGSTSSPAGSETYLADRWFVQPTGAAVTQQQSTTVPIARSSYSLQINGAASVTACVVAQRLEAIDTPQDTLTIQARIYNNTGSPITPSLEIDTPSATDDWTTSTNRLSQALQACPNGSWTQVFTTFTTMGMVNISKGVQIGFDFGALTSGDVLITQVQMERGSALTTYRARPYGAELALCQRYYQRLEVADGGVFGLGGANTATNGRFYFTLSPPMRGAPSISNTTVGWFQTQAASGGANTDVTTLAFDLASPTGFRVVYADATGASYTTGDLLLLKDKSGDGNTAAIILTSEL